MYQKRIGFIDPVTAVTVVTSVVKFFSSFGKDEVPNYPIKSADTLKKLQDEVLRNVTLPPSSVADARVQLERAQNALQREMSGSGVANQSIRMMYQEVITALQNYIARGGQTNTGGSGGSVSTQNNTALILAGAALVAFYFYRKNR